MTLQVLFQNRHPDRIATLEEYRRSGGYEALEKTLRNYSGSEIRQIALDALLLGRGGAGFPAGKKWMTVAENAPFPRFIVCNADEMEPGTFKDRVLIHADPHQIIEGMIITGYSVLAEKGIIFIRSSYENAARILEREIANAKEAGFLGKNILKSSFSMEIAVHRSAGRYICGENTAQINAIQGKRANPVQPPPYATEKGIWNLPTVTHNVETLACVPHIIRNGHDWFKSLSRTSTGAGTKLYCVSGRIRNPGCFELPMGTRLSEIIEDHAEGLPPGYEYKTCLPGGASTSFLPKDLYHIEMDFESLKKAGHRLGTGSVIVFDQKTCLVGATLNMIEFFARESCGWCTPCREGLPLVRDILYRIETGDGKEEHISWLRQMSKFLRNSYCALAPGAAAPVESLLTYFEDEVREHINQRKCPFM